MVFTEYNGPKMLMKKMYERIKPLAKIDVPTNHPLKYLLIDENILTSLKESTTRFFKMITNNASYYEVYLARNIFIAF